MPSMTEAPPVGDWLELAPWRTRAVSFLLLTDFNAIQAHDLPDKRRMLSEMSGQKLVLWHGKHYTSARRIATPDDLFAVIERLS